MQKLKTSTQRKPVGTNDISTFMQPEATPMPKTDQRLAATHPMQEQALKFVHVMRKSNRAAKVDKRDARTP